MQHQIRQAICLGEIHNFFVDFIWSFSNNEVFPISNIQDARMDYSDLMNLFVIPHDKVRITLPSEFGDRGYKMKINRYHDERMNYR